jgi:hypothetical protein
LREAVEAGEKIRVYAPGLGKPVDTGFEFLEGPWYPESHKWWAKVRMEDGIIVKVY